MGDSRNFALPDSASAFSTESLESDSYSAQVELEVVADEEEAAWDPGGHHGHLGSVEREGSGALSIVRAVYQGLGRSGHGHERPLHAWLLNIFSPSPGPM